ncbi:hypothetical protein MTO96_031211 [Rhipicephalus appendiculatus]
MATETTNGTNQTDGPAETSVLAGRPLIDAKPNGTKGPDCELLPRYSNEDDDKSVPQIRRRQMSTLS